MIHSSVSGGGGVEDDVFEKEWMISVGIDLCMINDAFYTVSSAVEK